MLCYNRCLVTYWLLDRDLTLTTLYPPSCFPASPATCPGAVVLDFDPAQTINVPAGETRWWKDSQPLTGPVSVQGSNYGTDDWSCSVWIGTDCNNLSLHGVLDNWNPSASGTVTLGESLWLEVSSVGGATLDLMAAY